MLMMLAENLVVFARLLSFSDAISASTALISVAMLSILSRREPCQIEYVIVIYLPALLATIASTIAICSGVALRNA